MEMKKKLLLHSCCGPCSTSVIESLSGEYDVTIFYYNPNITDEPEYEKRKQNQKKFIDEYNKNNNLEEKIEFIEGDFEPEVFFDVAKGLENEKEGGKRCNKCFDFRLDKTGEKALELGFQAFGTTLTVSPHKNYNAIKNLGIDISERLGIEFLDRDFKKKNGYGRSVELSKKYELYRQHYCGCEFSKWFEKDK